MTDMTPEFTAAVFGRTPTNTEDPQPNRENALADLAQKYNVPAAALRGDTAEELETYAQELQQSITEHHNRPRSAVIPGQGDMPEINNPNPGHAFVNQLFDR